MGYHTDFTGTITVNPPLNSAEKAFIRDAEDGRVHLFHLADHDLSVNDEGTELEPNDSERTYDLPEWIAALAENLLGPRARSWIDVHRSADPRLVHFTCDHHLNGRIVASGEDSGDLWGIEVVDNAVFEVRPVINIFAATAERTPVHA